MRKLALLAAAAILVLVSVSVWASPLTTSTDSDPPFIITNAI